MVAPPLPATSEGRGERADDGDDHIDVEQEEEIPIAVASDDAPSIDVPRPIEPISGDNARLSFSGTAETLDADGVARLFGAIAVQRRADEGMVIEAPPHAARALASLFEGMARPVSVVADPAPAPGDGSSSALVGGAGDRN